MVEFPRRRKVALAYSLDSRWKNRSEFVNGRQDIIAFLTRKWTKELDYRLIKEFWAFTDNRIAVRFAYEWHDDSDHWYRSYGNENWEFNDDGLMRLRFACINDLPIKESDRKYRWALELEPRKRGPSVWVFFDPQEGTETSRPRPRPRRRAQPQDQTRFCQGGN